MARDLAQFLLRTVACRNCGRNFQRGLRRVFCTALCAEGNYRRFREDRRAIPMALLGQRDAWTCHLCNEPVDPNGMGRMAATRDHLIPKSRGGRLTWENVKLAHLVCNARRGATELLEIS